MRSFSNRERRRETKHHGYKQRQTGRRGKHASICPDFRHAGERRRHDHADSVQRPRRRHRRERPGDDRQQEHFRQYLPRQLET